MTTMTESVPTLGRRLAELRRAAGMSQQALATAAGLSVSLVAQLERGARPDPKLSTLLALAGALGVTVNDLLAPPARGKRGKADV
jgi:XRE family transcriptional regulator, fatty acid utilization regulator